MELIDELVIAFLEGDMEISHVYNRQTGELLVDAPESLTGEPGIDWDDSEAVEFLVEVPEITSEEAYDVMVNFAKKQNADIAGELLDVLNGRKPFRSFKDKISEYDIGRQWYDFENDYAKARMTEWLAENK